jgi:hypothetical protein
MGKVKMLNELRRIVDMERDNGRQVVIVIDEAQNFSASLLEELRLLTCLDSEKSKTINIVLIGQPQLNYTLESTNLDQLRQRCRLRFHLSALSEDETSEYVRHRIAVAGGEPDKVFDEETISSIFGLTRGIPRLINTLCDTAMIIAFTSKHGIVSSESIDDAVRELRWAEAADLQSPIEEVLGAGSAGRLTISKDGALVAEHALSLPRYTIGRSSDCSIVISDKYLSRHHALLAHNPAGWTISDLNSTNGISVNGQTVKQARLGHDDIIGIGHYRMRLSLDTSLRSDTEAGDSTSLYRELPDLASW